MMKRYTTILMLTLIMASGCSQEMRDKNLKKVAKDWCMVIRASQVVPVYPLTEDLQVGDIFLVQHTVHDQHKQYEERGFLPMDNLISRLEPRGFSEFYDCSFAPNQPDITLPAEWLEPGKQVSWGKAPGAAFPTYSFSVKSGAGLSLAVPVQSVPIALSLMGADAGDGTISIGDAKTYGIDTVSLYQDVLRWEERNHAFLLNYASTKDKTNYVRVVSRVYLTGKMNVSIRAAKSWAGGLSVGDPKPLELLTVKSADTNDIEAATLENYTKSLEKLNTSIEDVNVTKGVLPGGTIKIAAASSRAVSMVEEFKRPLAIGYLGFDMAIGPDGVLGPPIPTHAVLTGKGQPSLSEPDRVQMMKTSCLAFAYNIIKLQAEAGDERAQKLQASLDKLGQAVPRTYPLPIYDSNLKEVKHVGDELRSKQPMLLDFTMYYNRLARSLEALKQADESSEQKKQWLQRTRKAKESMEIKLKRHRVLVQQALEYAGHF